MDRDGSGFDLRFSMRLRAFSVVQDLTYKNSSNSTIFCKFLLENIERSKYTISKTSGIYLFSTFIYRRDSEESAAREAGREAVRLASKLFLVAKISPKAEPKRALRPISCRGGARVSLGLLLGCCKIFRSSWAMNLLPAERLDKSSGRQADRQAWTSLQRSPASKKTPGNLKTPHLKNQSSI